MTFNNPYMSIRAKIQALQRWIIVQSVLYYEEDESIVSDNVYDANSQQLASLMAQYPEDAKQSNLDYVMYDFDGSTGFHIFGRLNREDKAKLFNDAKYALKLHKEGPSK